MSTLSTFGVDPEILKVFGFWGSILVFKIFLVVLQIGYYRFQKKIFLNQEDAGMIKGSKVLYNDADIERARRAHMNDIENIPIWFIVTFLWLTTGPSAWLAGVLIRTFVVARIVHTIVYIVLSKQPHRALAYFVALGVTLFEIFSTLECRVLNRVQFFGTTLFVSLGTVTFTRHLHKVYNQCKKNQCRRMHCNATRYDFIELLLQAEQEDSSFCSTYKLMYSSLVSNATCSRKKLQNEILYNARAYKGQPY